MYLHKNRMYTKEFSAENDNAAKKTMIRIHGADNTDVSLYGITGSLHISEGKKTHTKRLRPIS
jgi:hypothetical protein